MAALTPWNFPLVLSARKISTALAAGCSVIVKPDVITPCSVMEIVDKKKCLSGQILLCFLKIMIISGLPLS